MARTILKAPDGMILTDGKNIYGTMIFLAEDKSPDDFYGISKEEYEKLMEEDVS